MEFLQNMEITTPIGIATLTTLFIQLFKKYFVFNKANTMYSLIILGCSFAVSGIISWVAVPIFDILPKDALYNWAYGWMGATFGFQVIKSASKIIKKDQK